MEVSGLCERKGVDAFIASLKGTNQHAECPVAFDALEGPFEGNFLLSSCGHCKC